MGIETDILRALQVATGEAVAASDMPELPIKYIGLTFIVPSDQKYLEIIHLPNNISGQYWGSEKTYRGTLRLILHWQNAHEAPYVPISLIEQIGTWFEKGKTLDASENYVQIYDVPDWSGLIEAGQETLFVLSVRYQCFAVQPVF